MSSTRRPPTRNTAAQATLERARLGLAQGVEAPANPAAAGGFDADAAVQLLAGEFEKILGEERNLDPALRDQLQAQFVDALRDAAKQQASVQLPTRDDWRETVQSLQDSGAVEAGDAGELLRKFDSAIGGFERRDSRVAIEFARRLNDDGEEQALAWYRAQNASDPAFDVDAAAAPVGADVHPLRSEFVKSRSRTPRGPPSGR